MPRQDKGPPDPASVPARRDASSRTRRWRLAIGAAALLGSAVTAFVMVRGAHETVPRPPGQTSGLPDSTTAPPPPEAAPRPGEEPGEVAARSERARLALGRGDWAEAWQQTQAILRETPGDPLALTFQALVRFTMGQPEAAILMLQQAQSRAPNLLDTYAILSLIYAKTGRLDLAEQVMSNAEERFPTRRQLLGQMFADLRSQVVRDVASAASPPSADLMIPAHGGGADAPGTATFDSGELRVSGRIALAEPFRRHDGAARVLFVIVHDASSPEGSPLALRRLEAGSFPVRFALHDGDSVLGTALPNRFRVEARLDEDGDPETRSPSDLVADSGPVASGASGIELKLAAGPP